MSTTALAEDSAVSRLVRLIEEAQQQRAASERIVESFARYYTPAVVAAAALLALVPWLAHAPDPHYWLYLALVLLVVACPCALVISTPVVSVCGIARAARDGVLIKGGAHLETLGALSALAMDKTGTLTEGRFQVVHFAMRDEGRASGGHAGSVDKHQCLSYLASVESCSSHPMAAALLSFARRSGADATSPASDYETLPGEGVSATVDGRLVHVGNARLAERMGWEAAFPSDVIASWQSEGGTVVWVGVDGAAVAALSAADRVRSEAREAVREMREEMGLTVVMLTGDNSGAAAAVQRQVRGGAEGTRGGGASQGGGGPAGDF